MEEKEFEEKPIPLITEGFDLETDGIEFLQKLSDKSIAIISIIGPIISGKSFLATQIAGKVNKGFEINSANNKESLTKGIWVWGKPIIKENYYILILDAQGLKTDTEENLVYSQKIFSLCTLISSIVIYNYKNDKENNKLNNEIIQQSYDLFNKMIPFLHKIKLEDNEELSEEINKITKMHIPDFYWVYRDSTINDFSAFNELEKNFLEKNEYFNSLFKDKIKKYSLPCPMEKNKMETNSYNDISDEEINKGTTPFNKEYITIFNSFKNKLINKCSQKIIKNLSLNGNLFYGLLQEYASSIFSGDYMFVESPLSNVIFSNLGEITENITETFKEKLEEKNNEVYDIIQILKNTFEVFSDGLLNEYQNSFTGKLLHTQFMSEEMNNILSSVSDEVLDTNINEKLNQFNDSIKELIEKESTEKIPKIELITDVKKNLNDFASKIKSQLEENIFKKENCFLNSYEFIKDYIIKNICNKINSYADSIQFYIEHNLQTVESSSKLNEAAFEAKIKELNEKENELNKIKVEKEELKLKKDEKEKEFNFKLKNEEEKYKNLKQDYEKIIKEKDSEIKELKSKKAKEKEIQEELNKIKNENTQLKVDLGLKDKEINSLNLKFSKLKEIEEKKRKLSTTNEVTDLNILKEKDIPKLKEILREINKTVMDYSDKVNKLEQNKDIVFHDKFIEINKTSWEKTYNDWNEELNQFKEEHYKTVINNYSKEIAELKKENNNLVNYFNTINNNNNNKNIEILKLNQQMKIDKEIYDINKEELKKTKETAKRNEIELDQIKIRLAELENHLGQYKITANILEEQVDYIKEMVRSMIRKDRKTYTSYLNKMQEDYKKIFMEFNRTFNIFK